MVERFGETHTERLTQRLRHHRETRRIASPVDVGRLQPGRREHVSRERAVCLRRVGSVLVRPADCGANFQHREHSVPDRNGALCHLQERGITSRENRLDDGLLRRLCVSRRYSRRASLRLSVAKQVERNLIRRQAVMLHKLAFRAVHLATLDSAHHGGPEVAALQQAAILAPFRVVAGCDRSHFGIGFAGDGGAKLRFELSDFAGQSLQLCILLGGSSLDAKKRIELLPTLTQTNLDLLCFGHA